MNHDIQPHGLSSLQVQGLIDRYLSEGLPAEELAALSAAVHSADVPEEWAVVAEMIDALTEGEDDYDLLMAARTATHDAGPLPQSTTRRAHLALRWGWAAAACLLLVCGAAALMRNPSSVLSPEADDTCPATAALNAEPSAPQPAAEALLPSTSIASAETDASTSPRSSRRAQHAAAPEMAEVSKTAPQPAAPVAKIDQQTQAEGTTEPPEVETTRRIYSCNLLDEVDDESESPETSASAAGSSQYPLPDHQPCSPL